MTKLPKVELPGRRVWGPDKRPLVVVATSHHISSLVHQAATRCISLCSRKCLSWGTDWKETIYKSERWKILRSWLLMPCFNLDIAEGAVEHEAFEKFEPRSRRVGKEWNDLTEIETIGCQRQKELSAWLLRLGFGALPLRQNSSRECCFIFQPSVEGSKLSFPFVMWHLTWIGQILNCLTLLWCKNLYTLGATPILIFITCKNSVNANWGNWPTKCRSAWFRPQWTAMDVMCVCKGVTRNVWEVGIFKVISNYQWNVSLWSKLKKLTELETDWFCQGCCLTHKHFTMYKTCSYKEES